MSSITDDVKKVVLAGIGAAAITAEKAHDLADELVKKGENIVAEGKVANQELKHKIKNKVKGKEDEVVADTDYKEVEDEDSDVKEEEKKEQ